MAEDTTEMQIMDTSSDPITGTPEQGTQQTGMPSPTMQRDEMPRFETLGPERQLELLNLFPNMERNAILGLMESGMSFEDALEQMNRMMQNPPPEIRQDEFGPDVEGSIEMYFHRTTLKEAGFYPEIGDIVDWNRHYYEMNTVVEPQLIAGHHGFNHQIKTVAHKIKTSNLQIEERVK